MAPAEHPLARALADRAALPVHPDDAERVAAARRALTPGAAIRLDYRLELTDGPVRIADVCAARPGAAGAVRLEGVLVDLDAARRREVELQEAARMQALGELASGLAHEINNPLSGVLNYAQLAQRIAPEDARLCEALDGIVTEGRRIEAITRALLTCAPSDRGPLPLRPADVLHAAVSSLRRQLREAFVSVTVEAPLDLPQLVAHGLELQQALRYVLDEARDALAARFPQRDPEKRIALRARVEDAPTHQVVLEVEDRAGGAPSGSERLARARTLVERQGARWELAEGPGGTTVRLRFPI